jgi:hypothetical protein
MCRAVFETGITERKLVRVLAVDDQALVRSGLRRLIDAFAGLVTARDDELVS